MKSINLIRNSKVFIANAIISISAVSSVYASDAVVLDVGQLDSISAGNSMLSANVRGRADARGDSIAVSGVNTNANVRNRVSGKFRFDSVTASGVSYACCEGGRTSLDIELNSNADRQFGFVRIYSIESRFVSARIGASGIIGVSDR